MRSGDEFDAADYLEYAGEVGKLAYWAIKKLDPKPGEKILDIGCGDGTVTKIIMASGAEVYGIDVSDKMLYQAIQKGVNASKEDVTNLSFADGTFDKVFSNSALHWVPDVKKAFSEISRVLKDGGSMSVEFALTSPPEITRQIIESAKKYGCDVKNNNPWNRSNKFTILEHLKNLGFDNIEIKDSQKLQSLPKGIVPWMNNFIKDTFLKGLPEEKKELIINDAEKNLAKFPNYFQLDGVKEWFADYNRILVTGTKNKEKARVLGEYTNQAEAGVRGLNK
jgi:ubiquinone/menaquinone biosynthesis C-methylase UbiE